MGNCPSYRVLRPDVGDPLLRPEGRELGQGEVLGEPPGHGHAVDGLGRPASGELGVQGDVGRAADLVLVAGDEHPSVVETRSGSMKSAHCSMASW